MTWFDWFIFVLGMLCWGRQHESPLRGEHDSLLPQEMRIAATGTALGWTAYGSALNNKS